MAKILLPEQIASTLLFEYLKENHFESREYDVLIPENKYLLQGKCTLCYDPSQPTLTEIEIDEISLIDKLSDTEIDLDEEVLTETVKSLINDFTYEKNRTE